MREVRLCGGAKCRMKQFKQEREKLIFQVCAEKDTNKEVLCAICCAKLCLCVQ